MISKTEKELRWARIAKLARDDAKRLEEAAGRSGERHDGGAQALRTVVDAWMAGLVGQVPMSLEKYEFQDNRESDPEYSEFVRLKKKFER